MLKRCKKTMLALSILIFIVCCESTLTSIIPVYRADLYGDLSSKAATIYQSITICFIIYFLLDFFQSIKSYFVLKVALLYRSTRTLKIVSKGIPKLDLDNIPQRIQEDIKLFYVNRITVLCEYFISTTIVLQLIWINRHELILIGLALTYTLISVIIAIMFNPRLTVTEKEVQKGEASYRESFSRGFSLFSLQVANLTSLKAASIRTGYLLFTKLQLGILSMAPFAVMAPALLSGSIDMATIMKHQGTFSLLVVNAGILIQLYPTLIQSKASEERVKELEK